MQQLAMAKMAKELVGFKDSQQNKLKEAMETITFEDCQIKKAFDAMEILLKRTTRSPKKQFHRRPKCYHC